MKFLAEVKENKIVLKNKEIFQSEVAKLNGKLVELDLKEVKSKRSLAQNAYFWGVIVEILSKELGYSSKEMHNILKGLFLTKTVLFKNDWIEYTVGTSELDTKEFEKIMDEIRMWAIVEWNIWIPEPNESEFSY